MGIFYRKKWFFRSPTRWSVRPSVRPPARPSALPSRGRRSRALDRLRGYQLSLGSTLRLPRSISLSYGSLGRGDGCDLSGWPVQLWVYSVVHSESAAGSPIQPRAYAVAARNAAGPPSSLFKSFGRVMAST
jgi:hypothetical protein